MSDLEAFRREIVAFIEARCPASMRTPLLADDEEPWGGRRGVFKNPDTKVWLDAMAERGWTAPTWPLEYGGGGLTDAEARVLEEELRRAGCRPALKSLGIWMLGPVLLQFGSEAQKRAHLPAIVRGQSRWCQGYSEPGAGSDLASLQTRAVLDGDHYVVEGSKVWTSHADKADWMFCLVRTDPSAPKHEGIGFLLIDMSTPGISVRPIRLISGASPFCETFFEGVRVPHENLVGGAGRGWTIAKALLSHERALISKMRDERSSDDEALDVLAKHYLGTDDHGRIADPVVRDRVAQVQLDTLCNKLTLRRSEESARAGHGPGPETSMFKLYGTELSKRRLELSIDIAGYAGVGWEGPGFEPEELARTRTWLRSRASSIEGGSSEIQLNVIAKRVLGLPD
ncbi:MAG: acyl-CoA dehydrogenase family protein [Polyangiales bacterium]